MVCGLILMAVINETMGMGIIIPAAQCDLALSSSRKGVISAVSFIGRFRLFYIRKNFEKILFYHARINATRKRRRF